MRTHVKEDFNVIAGSDFTVLSLDHHKKEVNKTKYRIKSIKWIAARGNRVSCHLHRPVPNLASFLNETLIIHNSESFLKS